MDKNKGSSLGFTASIALISIILIFVLFGGALKLYGAMVGNNADSDRYMFSYKPIIVVSGSMLPTIQVNSINVVKKCEIDDLELNDIVMYKADNGMLITHRVKEFIEYDGEKAIIAKGDNNDTEDPLPVLSNQIRGKIVFTWNAIAPLLSDVLPSHGSFNAMSIIRATLVIVLIVMTISLIIRKFWEISMSIYYIDRGSNKFNSELQRYKLQTGSLPEIERLIEEASVNVETNMSLMTKLRIGLARFRVISSIKTINSEIDILTSKAQRLK